MRCLQTTNTRRIPRTLQPRGYQELSCDRSCRSWAAKGPGGCWELEFDESEARLAPREAEIQVARKRKNEATRAVMEHLNMHGC